MLGVSPEPAVKVEAVATLGRRSSTPGMTGMPSFIICAVLGAGGSRDLQAVFLKGCFNPQLVRRVPSWVPAFLPPLLPFLLPRAQVLAHQHFLVVEGVPRGGSLPCQAVPFMVPLMCRRRCGDGQVLHHTRSLPSLAVSASTEKQPQGVPPSRAAETWGGVHQGPAAPQETQRG